MSRFMLDPAKTAMENLYAAARIAVVVIARSHRWWGMVGDCREELFENIREATVEHFIRHKVLEHKYCRVAKDGRKLNFADNVISSCFAVASNVADMYLKDFIRRYNSDDIEPIQYGLSVKDRFPLYVSEYEKKTHVAKDINELGRPMDRARRVREYYEDYCAEVQEMGLSETLPFGRWLCRCGYNQDAELMAALLTPAERKEMQQLQAEAMRRMRDDELIAQGATDRELAQKAAKRSYMREWFRRDRERKRIAKDRELAALYGPAPKGYRWVEYSTGRIGQRRIK